MSYHVRLTARAQTDLDQLFRTLTERSPARAERLSNRFDDSLKRLETFPYSCGIAHENPRFTEELRHLLFWVHPQRKYRALFVVREDEVVVLAIRAPGERPVTPEDVEN
ncbi:MAG: type II toxin-antitoxin system RelE/ParE family toxin [Isosphaeraceae bacterium]